MVERTHIWTQMFATHTAIIQNLSPRLQDVLAESIFNGVQGWGHLGLAYYIRPEPMTIAHIRQRNPYSRHEKLIQDIQNLRDANFLDENDVITDDAHDAYQGLIDAQDSIAKEIDLVSEDTLQDIVTAYQQLNDAIAEMDAPNFKDVSQVALPDGLVHRLYYLGFRLATWRDDAHLQAWQHLDIDGHSYEAFSLIWDGTASNAEKLMEARGGRGYEVEDWQATLDSLVDKGWLVKDGDDYTVSAEGKAIRDAVEEKTDDIFYAPFAVLDTTKIEHLLTLLKDVQERFTPEPEAN